MLAEPYREFHRILLDYLPSARIVHDPLHAFAFGTDASFYRLVPKLVVKTVCTEEVSHVLRAADALQIPVTFRAAGTSLSGQAVTDSVLLVAGDGWNAYQILEGGAKIRLQPGIIGSRANRLLAPFGRKIGPDPASINAAMIGGIAANNASGMCCGTAQNSYRTVASLKMVFADGTVLDTGDPASCNRFEASHSDFLAALDKLGRSVRKDKALADRIRQKFKIKNTTGYSLNALVDFEDPLEIITHLMIGSEGTLGFLSEIVYHTVEEKPHKATALLIFPDIDSACRAVARLEKAPVAAAEIMDGAALRSVRHHAGMPADLKTLSPAATALLVETGAADPISLQTHQRSIAAALQAIPLTGSIAFEGRGSHIASGQIHFCDEPAACARLWDIRKGLFPAVGAMRRLGTTVIIEDVAFPMEHLAAATRQLQALFATYGYDDAIIFGHALAGNLHFVFPQNFDDHREIERYRNFMDAVCHMVVDRFDGSLKAEHGTGRNMAPYVEMEWGHRAYGLMKTIKNLFDPKGVLNPGVVLSDNPRIHVQNLKQMPPTHPQVDKCIECGFCEAVCPSKNLTLTPRQRIVLRREISRLESARQVDLPRLEALRKAYRYPGEQTCAADGLCELACPVDINTADLTKALRAETVRPGHHRAAAYVAEHFAAAATLTRTALSVAHLAHCAVGARAMQTLSATARRLTGDRLGQWNPYLPRPASKADPPAAERGLKDRVVYFPSCIARTMGPARGDPDRSPLQLVIHRVLQRAGYALIALPDADGFCCGMPLESKGFEQQAGRMSARLENALLKTTQNGRLAVLCDNSPCVQHMRQVMSDRLQIYEPVEFSHRFLLDRLRLKRRSETVALHITCSSRKMGLEGRFREVAEACARAVVIPEEVGCCGFAGDRGFNFPELTASALKALKSAVNPVCRAGYSNSRTCEIGLSLHSGIFYKSIFYLLDRCSSNGPPSI